MRIIGLGASGHRIIASSCLKLFSPSNPPCRVQRRVRHGAIQRLDAVSPRLAAWEPIWDHTADSEFAALRTSRANQDLRLMAIEVHVRHGVPHVGEQWSVAARQEKNCRRTSQIRTNENQPTAHETRWSREREKEEGPWGEVSLSEPLPSRRGSLK